MRTRSVTLNTCKESVKKRKDENTRESKLKLWILLTLIHSTTRWKVLETPSSKTLPMLPRKLKNQSEEEEGIIKRRKRKQVEVMISPTNLNHQLESCECPHSAGKHLIVEPVMICYRRASLRSSKRIIETGGTSAFRCSQPRESREHSSDPDVFQQALAYQVPAGSPVESPLGHLRQVARPSTTLAPEMIHEVTEEVGNAVAPGSCTVYAPKVEKGCEADKSMPNHSNNLEERTNKNHGKSISVVESPSPSSSLNLTKTVNMWDDQDDEVNSVDRSSPIDTVDGYQVKPEFVAILRKILSKHRDIVKDCTVSTQKYRSMLLEMICDIISKLQEKDFGKIKEDDLHDMIALLNEIKTLKVDIEWLHLRLRDILETRQILKLSGMLKEKKESNRKIVENVERELEECEVEKKAMEAKLQAIYDKEAACKKALAKARDEFTRMTTAIANAKSKVKCFLNSSLVDGLL